MRHLVLSFILLSISNISQAGWIIGSDSFTNGVLKVEKNLESGLIIFNRCESVAGECKEIAQREESTLDALVDYAQIAGSFFIHAAPTAMFSICLLYTSPSPRD